MCWWVEARAAADKAEAFSHVLVVAVRANTTN
jgi:hypothetical protein